MRTITRTKRSDEVKRNLVMETAEKGSSVTIVAHKHKINPGLIYKWRREFAAKPSGVDSITLPTIVRAASSEIDKLKLRISFLETSLKLANEQIQLYRSFIFSDAGIKL